MKALDHIPKPKRLSLTCKETGETMLLSDWAAAIGAKRGTSPLSVYTHLLFVSMKSDHKTAYGLTWQVCK